MNREKQLAKNTMIVALGQICTKFISFFLLPLYTALLTAEQYGIVDLLNTYISLLIPILFFQMDQAIFRFLIDTRKKEKETKKLISTALLTVTIQAVIFLILYLVVCIFINNDYKYFLLSNVIFTMYSSVLLQITRGLGDNSTYSLGSLISGTSCIILNVIFIAVLKWGAYGMLLATMLSNVFTSIFIIFKKKIYKNCSIKYWKREQLKELWKYSLPLVPNQLSWWIVNASDRTIVSCFLGVGANGIYSAANKFSTIIITFFNIFNMTWSESAALHFKDKDNDKFFSNIINVTLKLFTSVCIVIIACMPFVFKLLITGISYSDAYFQIPILMIATIFNIIVSLLGSVYVALKKSGEIAKTSIYSAIINIGVNLALIKFVGLYAASISTLVSYLAMAIYRYIDVQKYVKIKVDKNFIFLSLPVICIILYIYYLKNFYLCIVGLIITIVFVFVFNKDILKIILSTIKKKL